MRVVVTPAWTAPGGGNVDIDGFAGIEQFIQVVGIAVEINTREIRGDTSVGNLRERERPTETAKKGEQEKSFHKRKQE